MTIQKEMEELQNIFQLQKQRLQDALVENANLTSKAADIILKLLNDNLEK